MQVKGVVGVGLVVVVVMVVIDICVTEFWVE